MTSTNGNQKWLSLSDYSTEYGISISTLRRRIKGSQIKFKMINGKYFLARQGVQTHSVSSSVPRNETPMRATVPEIEVEPLRKSSPDDNTFQTAKSLLDELKKAYLNSLQDKEKQIIQLKQQIADLKTLVMYLERENERLQSQ